MGVALPVVAPEARVESVLRLISPEHPAVLVKTGKSSYDILTKYDVINAVARASEN
jgi:predicted transcriptional regulator